MTAWVDGPRVDAQVFDVTRDHVTDWLTRTGDPAAEVAAEEQVEWDPEPEYGPYGPGWRTAPERDVDEASI